MKKKILMLLGLAFAVCAEVQAQTVALEKTHEISNKARRGGLAKFDYNEENGDLGLTYTTKLTSRKYKFETYNFDKDFTFKKMDVEEGAFVRVKKAKKTKSKTKFKGENYERTFLRFFTPGANRSLLGLLLSGDYKKPRVLETVKKTYTYNADDEDYDVSEQVISKIDLVDSKGNKLYSVMEDDLVDVSDTIVDPETGDETYKDRRVFIGDNKKGEYVFLKLSTDVNAVEKEVIIPQPANMELIKLYTIKYEKAFEVYFKAKKMKKKEIASQLKPTECMYIKFSDGGQELDRFKFDSPSAYWDIKGASSVANGETMVYGWADNKKNTKFTMYRTGKPTNWQVMRFKKGGAVYANISDFKEIKAKQKEAIKGKKGKSFDYSFTLKQFEIQNGELFITAQATKVNKKTQGKEYSDISLLQFGNDGKIKAQYSAKPKETNEFAKQVGINSDLIFSNDGKRLYWMLTEIDRVKFKEGVVKDVDSYARLVKIDLSGTNMGEFLIPGDGKFFLDRSYPILPSENGYLALFGANSKGGKLWYCRVKLD